MSLIPSVLVAGRHAAYALELRRCGLTVSEPDDLDRPGLTLSACVLDAVGDSPPVPAEWDRVLAVLRADAALPLVAVVNGEPPAWLAGLAARAELVQAPVSGRALADRVLARLAPLRDDEPSIDLGLTPARVVELVELVEPIEVDEPVEPVEPEPPRADLAVPHQAQPTLAVRPSAPLHMASLEELADRLLVHVHRSRSLREVGAELAVAVSDRLRSDVGVLCTAVEGTGWVVVAGVGLRDVEWRPLRDDPLVLGLLDAGHPILRVDASDDVRAAVAALPCARREHLLVGFHPAIPVLVVAGRDHPSFAREDVRALGRLLGEDGALTAALTDSLTLRALAAALAGHLDD